MKVALGVVLAVAMVCAAAAAAAVLEAEGCCHYWGIGSLGKKCCDKYNITTQAKCVIPEGMSGGDCEWLGAGKQCPAAAQKELAAEVNGCCHSWGYGARMKPCCDKYESTTQAECMVPPTASGGGCEWKAQACPAPAQKKTAVEAEGCCHYWGIGSLGKKCCDKYNITTQAKCVIPEGMSGGDCEWLGAGKQCPAPAQKELAVEAEGCCHYWGIGSLGAKCCDKYNITTQAKCVIPEGMTGGDCEWLGAGQQCPSAAHVHAQP